MFDLKLKSVRAPVWAATLIFVIAIVFGVSVNPTAAETPDETYKALGLDKNAYPNQLYDSLLKRYNDPAEGAGKGSFSKYWEPIPISKYLNPQDFYKPPQTVDVDATRTQCVECHQPDDARLGS